MLHIFNLPGECQGSGLRIRPKFQDVFGRRNMKKAQKN